MPDSPSKSGLLGPLVIAILVLLLLVLHQDNWLWNDSRLVLGGTMPIGMAWHVGISIAAALTWWLATWIAWPLNQSNESPTHSSEESTQ